MSRGITCRTACRTSPCCRWRCPRHRGDLVDGLPQSVEEGKTGYTWFMSNIINKYGLYRSLTQGT